MGGDQSPPPSHHPPIMRIIILALITLTAGTGIALSSETTYMHRECVANGNTPEECSVKLYGR